jgi:hypothetical protein
MRSVTRVIRTRTRTRTFRGVSTVGRRVTRVTGVGARTALEEIPKFSFFAYFSFFFFFYLTAPRSGAHPAGCRCPTEWRVGGSGGRTADRRTCRGISSDHRGACVGGVNACAGIMMCNGGAVTVQK